MIQVFTPEIGEEEIEAVAEVIRSKWIGLGPKTKEFEDKFADYIGVPEAVGVNSCTSALDLAMRLLDIGPGDEVLVPAMTFVSTAHAVAYNGARPVFVDCDLDTLNISLEDLERKVTPRTRAVIVVHFGGMPVDVDKVREIVGPIAGCIPVIEDCAHAAGSSLRGQMCGSMGDIGCFSFHAVKNLATGDGGCLTISEDGIPGVGPEEVASRAKKLRWLGIDKGTWDRTGEDRSYWWKYNVDEIGLKCHMNDITAAIALVQLGKLERMNERRREIARRYIDELRSVPGLMMPKWTDEDTVSSWHIFSVKLINDKSRDDLSQHLRDHGINTGVHYMPIHLYDCYGWQPEMEVAELAKDIILSLPIHACLSDDDVTSVIEAVRGFYA
jgi:perosamine synthetase